MKRFNNKGVSLVELLVAVAVGAIVLSALTMLVTQGTKSYKTQVATAQLQNDANITLNQLEEAVMEATQVTVEIETNADGTEIADSNTVYLKLSESVVYIYDTSNKTLYLAKDKTSDKSVVCENVAGFNVKLAKSSFKTKDDGTGNMVVSDLSNPVRIQIDLVVAKDGQSRDASRYVSLRNILSLEDIHPGNKEMKNKNVSIGSISDYVSN